MEPTANMHQLLYFHGAQCALETQLLSVAMTDPHLAEHAGSCFLPTLKSEETGQRKEEDKALSGRKCLCIVTAI